jgi:uncharacterized protein (TIGR02452 family)
MKPGSCHLKIGAQFFKHDFAASNRTIDSEVIFLKESKIACHAFCNMRSPEFNDLKKPFVKLYTRFQRKMIAEFTKGFFPEILGNADHGERVVEGIKNTRFYKWTLPMPPVDGFRTEYDTIIKVHAGDTLDVALELQNDGHNPCVLNFASHSRPGGGWLTGARAQEEELFIRSAYDLSLSDPTKVDRDRHWHYPIPEKGGIYSPDVFVFRDNESNKYAVWDWKKCRYVNFVAVAALRNPKTENNRLNRRDTYVTKEKIKTILRIALLHNHDCMLLGAFGCGAFRNPPQHMAELFNQVINMREFRGQFKRIDFAILDDKETSNYEIFKNVLCPKGKEPVRCTTIPRTSNFRTFQTHPRYLNDEIVKPDDRGDFKIDYEMNSMPWFM